MVYPANGHCTRLFESLESVLHLSLYDVKWFERLPLAPLGALEARHGGLLAPRQ
jgi:hypothetical protein